MRRPATAALLVLLAVLLTPRPAHAGTHNVTLSPSGPSPSAVTIVAGETITFRAGDGNRYHVRRTSGSWTFSVVVTSAKPVTTQAFTAAGTYGYAMTFDTLLGESPAQNGSVVVPASPKPSPTTRPSTSARPSSSPAPRPVVSAPAASASPTAAPAQSGVAAPPPIIGGVIPTANPTTSVGPAPQVAPGADPGFSPSGAPAAAVDYADPKGLVQNSSHGFGLPAALAVVAVVGVVTLLVRLLLAQPEARREL